MNNMQVHLLLVPDLEYFSGIEAEGRYLHLFFSESFSAMEYLIISRDIFD